MISEQSMVNVLIIGIQIVKDNVSITRVTCCKDDDFEMFTEVFKDLLSVRTDVDTSFNDLACGESNGKFDIVRRSQSVITVDQSFIQIENYCLFTWINTLLPS